jgi:alginate O-acetyltransferase complex protein AlgI
MLFDSTAYILFLAVVVLMYWRLSFRAQNYFLLAASYFFYGWWDWRFLALMAFSTAGDYIVARRIADESDAARRRMLLTISLVLNFGFLGYFKYFNFFVDSFGHVAASIGLGNVPTGLWTIVLPPAISFYTFQEVAYIVDVYYKRLKPAESLVDYALFVSLFPHLIAGPIQRPSHLLPQVEQPRVWDSNKAFDGLLLILEGLFRKVVVADNCALVANAALGGSMGEYNFPIIVLGVYAFAWQIYGDFSGYSCMARGSAQLLGFHFMVNFRQPYFAQSLQDFWRRWHISLSTWLRDYLYIPLGGNRGGTGRTYINLLLTMVLGGLWHGANWTFVVWGTIHGAGLAIERFLTGGQPISDARTLAGVWMRRLVVFHLVCLAWVFFRAPTTADAISQLSALTIWAWDPVYYSAAVFLAVFAGMLMAIDLHLEAAEGEYLGAPRSFNFRIATGLALCVLITLLGANRANAFIYFQF